MMTQNMFFVREKSVSVMKAAIHHFTSSWNNIQQRTEFGNLRSNRSMTESSLILSGNPRNKPVKNSLIGPKGASTKERNSLDVS